MFDINKLSNFYTLPEDQGQAVKVSYAIDSDNMVLCQRNESNGVVSYYYAEIDLSEEEILWEPWNGIIPFHCGWNSCSTFSLEK